MEFRKNDILTLDIENHEKMIDTHGTVYYNKRV